MIAWPKTLVKELVERRCLLFLGAGVSMTATDKDGKRPPSWMEFLRDGVALVKNHDDYTEISDLIEQKSFLLALQAIVSKSDPSDYIDLLNRTFVKNYAPSSLHEAIYQLDSRFVLTTNFDRIYENYCLNPDNEGFKVISYDSDSLGDEIRSDVRLIVKAHGSIDNISKMVFTREQYHKAKREYGRFYEIIKALFLTHTCVFIGCGMSDPDVNLLLEDVKILSSSVRPHYAIVQQGAHSRFIKEDWINTFNVRVLEYGCSSNHVDLVTDLQALADEVLVVRSTAR